MLLSFNFGPLSTHFLPHQGVPPSSPSHRRGTQALKARYNTLHTGGIFDRSRFLHDSYISYKKRLAARLQLHVPKGCWIADPDIAAARRHTMDETIDTSAWTNIDLRKRKHFASEGHTTRTFTTPTPVRRRITIPKIFVVGDMDVDGPEFYNATYSNGVDDATPDPTTTNLSNFSSGAFTSDQIPAQEKHDNSAYVASYAPLVTDTSFIDYNMAEQHPTTPSAQNAVHPQPQISISPEPDVDDDDDILPDCADTYSQYWPIENQQTFGPIEPQHELEPEPEDEPEAQDTPKTERVVDDTRTTCTPSLTLKDVAETREDLTAILRTKWNWTTGEDTHPSPGDLPPPLHKTDCIPRALNHKRASRDRKDDEELLGKDLCWLSSSTSPTYTNRQPRNARTRCGRMSTHERLHGRSPYEKPPPPWKPSASSCRPGLLMSQKKFDDIKDNILDLIGMGVDPEHFLEIGVSRETIFHAFTELSLRLPYGIDFSDLTPYHIPPRDSILHIETEGENVSEDTEEVVDTYDNVAAVEQKLLELEADSERLEDSGSSLLEDRDKDNDDKEEAVDEEEDEDEDESDIENRNFHRFNAAAEEFLASAFPQGPGAPPPPEELQKILETLEPKDPAIDSLTEIMLSVRVVT